MLYFENLTEAIDAGLSKEEIIKHWQNEFGTANALMSRQMSEMVDVWMSYNIPHSVVLVNLKILQRLVEETLLQSMREEHKKYYEQSMKEIDLLVDIAVEYGKERGSALWKQGKKPDFDPMCG